MGEAEPRPDPSSPAATPGRPLLGPRRPSGEPPPLPRPVSTSTRLLVGIVVVVVALWLGLAAPAVSRVVTRADLAVLDAVSELRTTIGTDLARHLDALGS